MKQETMPKHVTTFRGKPLDQMTRDELIYAVEWLGAELNRQYSAEIAHASLVGAIRMARKP